MADSRVLTAPRPSWVAASMAAMWTTVGIPAVAQFDNHSNFRGAIPPAWSTFGPVAATCLDLDVIARFIPLREPWRNGVVEHFNDVWDKSSSGPTVSPASSTSGPRTRPSSLSTTSTTATQPTAASSDEVWAGKSFEPLAPDYVLSTSLPAKGRIEVVRYIRSNRRLDLFSKRLTVAEEYTHQHVVATIAVRAKQVTVVTLNGEIVHDGDFALSRGLH